MKKRILPICLLCAMLLQNVPNVVYAENAIEPSAQNETVDYKLNIENESVTEVMDETEEESLKTDKSTEEMLQPDNEQDTELLEDATECSDEQDTELTEEENDPQYLKEMEKQSESQEEDSNIEEGIKTDKQTSSPFVGGTFQHDGRFDGVNPINGIDVSKYQGDINWGAVKAAGVNFVFIRAGYRGANDGQLYTDPKFQQNVSGATAAGINVGLYIFSQAISVSEGVDEANFLISKAAGYAISMPLVIDYEYRSGPSGRLYNAHLSKESATEICNAFGSTINSAGYTPMVYANKNMLQSSLNAASLNSMVWLARYNSAADYTGAYNFWQYSSKGGVSGINGYVDCDFWYNADGSPLSLSGICYSQKQHGIDVGVAYSTFDKNVQFRWMAYNVNTGAWSLIADWNGGNWATWRPTPGAYWLQVEGKISDGTIKSQIISYNVSQDFSVPYIDLNGICYNMKQHGIDVGVAYDSDDDNTEFKWQSYNLDTGEWKAISDWYKGNWMTWKPAKGNYWLYVEARSSKGATASQIICFNVSQNYNEHYLDLNGICSQVQKNSIDLGVAYDSDENVQFRWLSYDVNAQEWELISDWNNGNWTSWYPKRGTYWVQVQAKTDSGYENNYTVAYGVSKDYSAEYLELEGLCWQLRNTDITVGVAYDSSDQNVQVKWQAYNLDTKQWSIIADWNGGNWASWKPTQGNYWLDVQVKNSSGIVKEQTICFCVDHDY